VSCSAACPLPISPRPPPLPRPRRAGFSSFATTSNKNLQHPHCSQHAPLVCRPSHASSHRDGARERSYCRLLSGLRPPPPPPPRTSKSCPRCRRTWSRRRAERETCLLVCALLCFSALRGGRRDGSLLRTDEKCVRLSSTFSARHVSTWEGESLTSRQRASSSRFAPSGTGDRGQRQQPASGRCCALGGCGTGQARCEQAGASARRCGAQPTSTAPRL
jgi:hypothetical protein